MGLYEANTLKSFIPEKAFWKQLMTFSIPIAFQNMSSAILGIIDVSVISGMGETPVAAVSLANQIFYIVSLIAFGITSGASVYLARAYGEKNAPLMRKHFGIMLFFSVLINSIIMILCLVAPESALRIFTNDAETIKGGALYLLIIAPTFVFYCISSSFVAFFRSVNRPKIPMVSTIISLSVKTLLNVVLIYGVGFIPRMGIAGAAVATLISKAVEFLVYIFFVFRFKQKEYLFKLRDFKHLTPGACLEFLRLTYPVILNESLWGIGTSMFNAIFGRMSTSAVTAISVSRQLENLCNAFFYGVGIGGCVTISHAIGEKKIAQAKDLAKKYTFAGACVGVAIMLFMLIIDIPYVEFFFSNLETETRNMTMGLIAVFALYMPFRSMASAIIMGVLRAGGDSKKAMLYDVLPVFIWSLPLGYILGISFGCSAIITLAVMQFKRVIKCGFALRRILSEKWIDDFQEKDTMADNKVSL